MVIILFTKTTAAHDEVALSDYKARGLYFLAVIFAATIGLWGYQVLFSVHCTVYSVHSFQFPWYHYHIRICNIGIIIRGRQVLGLI